MGSKLNGTMINPGNDFTYSETYRTYLESHMKFLREHPYTQLVTLDKEVVYKNLYDFTAMLSDMGIALEDHYMVMRMNQFSSVRELTMDVEFLLLPAAQVVAQLKQLYRTTHGRV